MGTMMEAYIGFLAAKESPKRTVETYKSALTIFFSSFAELTLENIQAHLKHYKTPSSKRTILAAIRSYCGFHDISLPWHKIVLPKKKHSMPRTLDKDEQARIYRWIASRDPYYAKIFVLDLHTALRSAEIARLQPSDLFTDSTGASVLRIREPKNGMDRSVPLDATASRIVKEIGLPIKYRRQTLTALIKEARETLSIPKVTPHNLRKTCLTRLYREGANVVALARFAGHRDVNSLMDYLSTTPEDVRAGVHGSNQR